MFLVILILIVTLSFCAFHWTSFGYHRIIPKGCTRGVYHSEFIHLGSSIRVRVRVKVVFEVRLASTLTLTQIRSLTLTMILTGIDLDPDP